MESHAPVSLCMLNVHVYDFYPVRTTLFSHRRLASVGSSDRENLSANVFLFFCLVPTVETARAIRGCGRLPTYRSLYTDGIRI